MHYSMHYSAFLAATLATLTVAAPAADASEAACAKGLHILVARGTGQDQATGGDLQMVYSAVQNKVKDTTVSQIVYPASTDYASSLAVGVKDMRQQIKNYADRCPKTGIVLLGYSQGAQVIGDLLTGNGYSGNTNALNNDLIKHISAVVQIADPTQTANYFFNRGTGKAAPGRVVRSDPSPYNNYKGKIIEFCAADDYWCASGNDSQSGTIHANEVYTQKDVSVQFIVNHA